VLGIGVGREQAADTPQDLWTRGVGSDVGGSARVDEGVSLLVGLGCGR
jgi:hypothetical protein